MATPLLRGEPCLALRPARLPGHKRLQGLRAALASPSGLDAPAPTSLAFAPARLSIFRNDTSSGPATFPVAGRHVQVLDAVFAFCGEVSAAADGHVLFVFGHSCFQGTTEDTSVPARVALSQMVPSSTPIIAPSSATIRVQMMPAHQRRRPGRTPSSLTVRLFLRRLETRALRFRGSARVGSVLRAHLAGRRAGAVGCRGTL